MDESFDFTTDLEDIDFSTENFDYLPDEDHFVDHKEQESAIPDESSITETFNSNENGESSNIDTDEGKRSRSSRSSKKKTKNHRHLEESQGRENDSEIDHLNSVSVLDNMDGLDELEDERMSTSSSQEGGRKTRFLTLDEEVLQDDNDKESPEVAVNHDTDIDSSTKKRKKSRRKTPESREEDRKTIEMLKEANQTLKNQLMELNETLDKQLARKDVQIARPKKLPSTASDQEVKNLMHQIVILKKSNDELRVRLGASSESDRSVTLENRLQAKKLKIQKLKEENKSLKNVEREQSKALESYNTDSDKIVTQLKNEINFIKEKMRKVKEDHEKAKQIVEQKSKMLELAEAKYRNLEEIMKQANLTKGGIVESKKLEQDLEAKSKQLETIEKKLAIEMNSKESFRKQAAMQANQLKQAISKLEQQLEETRSQVEEKDKQLRVAILQAKTSGGVKSPTNQKKESSIPSGMPKQKLTEQKQSTTTTKPPTSVKVSKKESPKPVQKAIAEKSKLPVMKKRLSETQIMHDSPGQTDSPDVAVRDSFDTHFEDDFELENIEESVNEVAMSEPPSSTNVFAPDF